MESIEVSAKTVEEAVEQALEQLGLSREEVEVTVLKEGKAGFLGMGTEEAIVEVTPLSQIRTESNVATLAKEALEELLSRMKLTAEIELRSSLEGASSETESIVLEVKGNDLGILIGRRGETLASLQYLVRLIVAHYQKARVPITIDIRI